MLQEKCKSRLAGLLWPCGTPHTAHWNARSDRLVSCEWKKVEMLWTSGNSWVIHGMYGCPLGKFSCEILNSSTRDSLIYSTLTSTCSRDCSFILTCMMRFKCFEGTFWWWWWAIIWTMTSFLGQSSVFFLLLINTPVT